MEMTHLAGAAEESERLAGRAANLARIAQETVDHTIGGGTRTAQVTERQQRDIPQPPMQGPVGTRIAAANGVTAVALEVLEGELYRLRVSVGLEADGPLPAGGPERPQSLRAVR